MSEHVTKCWYGAAYMRSQQTCIFVLIVRTSAVLKPLEQYGYPNTSLPVCLINFNSFLSNSHPQIRQFEHFHQISQPFQGCGGTYGLYAKLGDQRPHASPFRIYPAGKLQWYFLFGFHFSHAPWLPFAAGFALLKVLLLIPVGTMGSF